MNQLKGKKELIDEELPAIRMASDSWVHMNMWNNCREFVSESFIKARGPIDTAFFLNELQVLFPHHTEQQMVDFIHMFRPDVKHECEMDDYDYDECPQCSSTDARGMTDEAMRRFNDFATQFKMCWMMGPQSTNLHSQRKWFPIVVDFVNRTRDLLIDDESDDEVTVGRWTNRFVDARDAHYFQNHQLDAWLEEYNKEGEEE